MQCRFLKERGIRARNVRNGFSRRIDEEDGAAAGASAEAGPSGSSSPAPVAGPSRRTSSSLAPIGETLIDDAGASSTAGETPIMSRVASTAPGTPAAEEDEEMEMVVASSSKSVTITSHASSSVSKKNKKKKKGDDDDEDYNDQQDDIFNPVAPKKARYADRKPGSFAMCAECNKKVGLIALCLHCKQEKPVLPTSTSTSNMLFVPLPVHCHTLYQRTSRHRRWPLVWSM